MAAKRKAKGCLHQENVASGPAEGVSDNSPKYYGDAAVDIIAVHGLASNYEQTWSVELENGKRYHWLRERLSTDLPHARVLGYEYGSDWYDDPTYSNLEECGAEFLRSLIRSRCHRGRPGMCPTRRSRPMILMGHSFGGLVIKQALVLAHKKWAEEESGNNNNINNNKNAPQPRVRETARRAQATNYRDLLCSIAGIIFLGTPHYGSSFSYWAEAKMAVGSLSGRSTYRELIKILRANSEPLKALQKDFEGAWMDGKLSDMLVYCYRETRQVPLPPYIVVPAESAWLDGAEKREMDADHTGVNKFGPGKDANYDKIIADMMNIFYHGAQSVPRRLDAWRYDSVFTDGDRTALQRWLNPSRTAQKTQYRAKLASHQAAPYTCHWLEDLEEFKSWKAGCSEQNILWIHGKPGAGKSVLAAFIINHFELLADGPAETKYQTCLEPLDTYFCGLKLSAPTVLYFFSGVDRAHEDVARLLGTLIHQLLCVHDYDGVLFDQARNLVSYNTDGADASDLVKLLQRLLSLLSNHVFIVIDGLEENPDYERCLSSLKSIATSDRVHLVILSQSVQKLREQLEWEWNVYGLPVSDHTHPDICRYTESRIAQLLDRKPNLEPKRDIILTTLQRGAMGVFQWVNAVIDHLENYVVHVDNVEDSLNDTPGSLRDAYEKVFRSMKAAKLTDQFGSRIRTALSLLAVTAVPITAAELEIALDVYEGARKGQRAGFEGIWSSKWSVNHEHDARSDLRSLLGPLIDVDADGVVSLVHTSLRTVLLDPEEGFHTDPGTSVLSNFTSSSKDAHRRLAEICVLVCSESTLMHANAFSEARPLFVEYAWNYWAYHLRASGAQLKQFNLEHAVDRMLHLVHRHTLSFLGALADFASNPLDAVPGHYTLLEYRQSLQRAQDALPLAVQALTRAMEQIPAAWKLQQARDRIPTEFFNHSIPGRFERAMTWLRRARSDLRNRVVKDQTRVTRVKLDDLMESSGAIGIRFPPNDVSDRFLDGSRSLRLVALRFAVNPVYSALLRKAGGPNFSPINILVYVAQMLEEAASFPYWHHLPDLLDPAAAFLCDKGDPQLGPAKFVLQSVQWKRSNKKLAAELQQPGQEETDLGRTVLSNRLLAKPSAEQERLVRQLHEIPGERWMMARYGFSALRGDGWFQVFVADHIGNFKVKEKLLMKGNEYWSAFTSPEVMLDRNAPTSVQESRVAEAIKAIPSMIKVFYVKYITSLLEVFAQVPRSGVVTHFIQLTTSKHELLECMRYTLRCFSRDNWQRLWHIFPALILYWLRCKLWPSLGAHAMAHPWGNLLLAYRHSAAYLDLQSTHDAWFWFKYAMKTRFYHAVGDTFISYGADRRNPGIIFADTFATFYHIISLERNVFGLCFAFAILVSSANVIFFHRENLSSVLVFSFWYWVISILSIFNVVVTAALQQNRAGFLPGLAVMLLEIALIAGLMYFETFIMKALYWLLSPIILPAIMLWKTFLYLYAPFVKICGIISFIFLVLLAVHWLDRTLTDPYNLQGSLKAVQKASALAKSVLQKKERISIGQYPLDGMLKVLPAQQSLEVEITNMPSANSNADMEEPNEMPASSSPSEAGNMVAEMTNDSGLASALIKLGTAAQTAFTNRFSDAMEVLKNTDLSNVNWRDGRFSQPGSGFGLNYESHSYTSTTTTTINGHTTVSHSSGSHSGWTSSPPYRGRYDGHSLGYDQHHDAFQDRNSLWGAQAADRPLLREENIWRRDRTRFGNIQHTSQSTQVPARKTLDNMITPDLFFVIVFIILAILFVFMIWSIFIGNAKSSCWSIGAPLGPLPVYVGYGCKGFFYELLL